MSVLFCKRGILILMQNLQRVINQLGIDVNASLTLQGVAVFIQRELKTSGQPMVIYGYLCVIYGYLWLSMDVS